MFTLEAIYVLVAILSAAFLIHRRQSSTLPLPPGPRGWPLIDNLFDWPFESAWIPFAEWSKLFGMLYDSKLTDCACLCDCVCACVHAYSASRCSSLKPSLATINIATAIVRPL